MTKPVDSKQAIPSPEDRVRAIREREQKATKGPYTLNGGNYLGIIAMVDGKSSQIGRAEGCGNRLSDEQVEDNARFIAHTRADIPYLLSLVEELKGQVVSASPQPTCPKCGSEVTWWITAKDQMPVVRCRIGAVR